jgi:hypothetical protein
LLCFNVEDIGFEIEAFTDGVRAPPPSITLASSPLEVK